MFSVVSVCLSICLSISSDYNFWTASQADFIFGMQLHLYLGLYLGKSIPRSSLSIKVIGSRSRSDEKNDNFTYFNMLILYIWLQVINKVKVTNQGEGHIKVKVKYLHPFKFYVAHTFCKRVVYIRLIAFLFSWDFCTSANRASAKQNVFIVFISWNKSSKRQNTVYIHKRCFIDSYKLDKHHKQYSKYGKKHSVVKLPKRLPFRNFFLCLQKKVPKW